MKNGIIFISQISVVSDQIFYILDYIPCFDENKGRIFTNFRF